MTAKVQTRPGRVRSVQVTESRNRHPPGRGRATLFHVGDAVFLSMVGAESTLVMHMVEQWGWSTGTTAVTGMLVATVIQIVLAVAAAPILGSIEAMTPSMVLAMVGPMMLDGLRMIGFATDARGALWVGVGMGVLMSCFVAGYGVVVRRSFRRFDPNPP